MLSIFNGGYIIMAYKNTRRLIRIGHVSLGIIIPRAWLRYYELKYGDVVDIISNGSITITPIKKEEKK